MPGLVGKLNIGDVITDLEGAVSRISYNKHTDHVANFSDEKASISAVTLSRKEKGIWKNEHNDHILFFVGDVYPSPPQFEQKLLKAYSQDKLGAFLSETDGIFCACIYDMRKEKLMLISDRYGLKPLYYNSDPESFVFSSELKCFPLISSDNKLEYDTRAFNCFLDIGYLIGDRSWFKNVRLLDASTILELSLKDKKIVKIRYWSWSSIDPVSHSFPDAVQNVYKKFDKAIEKRMESGTFGLSLSGGSDSRAILALCNERLKLNYTFGMRESSDLKFARELSDIYHLNHHAFILDGKNWFHKRVEGVWKTDGMVNLKHMHASTFHKLVKDLNCIHLHGSWGNVVFGASWNKQLDHRIGEGRVHQLYGDYSDLIEISNSFYDIDKEDPLYFDTRLRRFAYASILEPGVSMKFRLPFLDHDLVDYFLSLPDDYRTKRRMYKAIFNMLPEKVTRVINANTGLPPNTPKYSPRKIGNAIKNRFSSVNRDFTNYETWINRGRAGISKVLKEHELILPQLIKRELNLDLDENLFRFLTIEIYLQLLDDSDSSFITALKDELINENN